MSMIYHEQDGDARQIHTKTITIIGYDALGQYLCEQLRHQPVRLLVTGSTDDQFLAQSHGFLVEAPAIAVNQADMIFMNVPDESISELYMAWVARGLRREQMLIFKSGYAITYGFIEPPPFIDVSMISPRMTPQPTTSPADIRTFVGVWQDSSRKAWEQVLGFCKAVNLLDGGALEVSFEQETQLCLFVEQAIIPAFQRIMTSATELFTELGYPTDGILTDLYLSGKFSDYVEAIRQYGLLGALSHASKTTQYGVLSRRDKFNDIKFERLFESILADIRSGNFAKTWAKEHAEGHPHLDKLQKTQESHDLWDLEQQTLDLFHNG
ncbi:MAG: hypothetical protein KJ043_15610 [Anaerolineae bacterium]|nr:hypothetical protein [Anaerolineae bacterium]